MEKNRTEWIASLKVGDEVSIHMNGDILVKKASISRKEDDFFIKIAGFEFMSPDGKLVDNQKRILSLEKCKESETIKEEAVSETWLMKFLNIFKQK